MLMALGAVGVSAQEVLISEFVAVNEGSLMDGEGDEPDWIELQNTGHSSVDLTGWHLTDDAGDLNKWTFPSASIAPSGYLVVFASNKNKMDPAGNLHTNFKLSSDGEYLALVRPDQTVEHEYTPEYPPQYPDVSYGVSVVGATTETWIGPGAQSTYHVPTSNVDDVNSATIPWNEPSFDDSAWASTDLGVGYATADGDPYDTVIGSNGDVQSLMYDINPSIYIRIPFVVDDPAQVRSLTLWVRYDDGFAAYINGGSTTVAGANNPEDGALAYDSAGTAGHPDGNAINLVPFEIDLSGVALPTGTNLLAIHGLNRAALNSDFLFDCELKASLAATNAVSAPVYMTTTTPGADNAGGVEDLGPIFRKVTDSAPAQNLPTDTEIVVTARIDEAGGSVTDVTLYHRQRFDSETAVPMRDDGIAPDTVSGDGIYAATVPLAGLAEGQMIRWRIEAEDTTGKTSRAPLFHDPLNSPEYYGTIANDSSITSQLPTIQWFVEDEAAADTKTGARASAWFRSEFYDNFYVRLRGGSTTGFSKKSYKFDFNSHEHFRFDPDVGRAEEINLNQTWSDKSYIRQLLSFEMYDRCGNPGPESFVVRLHRNGQFHSLNAFVEQPDKRMLEREGLDDRGALYKMYNTFTSPGAKKNRDWEGNADLVAFIAAINNTSGAQLDQNIFDQVDIPRQLNYLAATVLAQHNDNMAKNYYLYRDSDGSGEWFQIAWDTDLSWGKHYMAGGHTGDTILWDSDYRVYNSSGDYISPSHPFVGPDELQGNRSWNRLIDKPYENPRFTEMFRRRLRTVMDELFAPPVLENRIGELKTQLTPDAAEDTAKWGQSGADQTLAQSLDILENNYLVPRRTHLFDTHSVNNVGSYPVYPNPYVVSAELPDAQPTNAVVSISTIEYSPASGNQDEEYICITNANDFAVDISRWNLSGGVSHTLLPGTVILPGESLYLTPSPLAFRARSAAPHGGMSLLVQGEYDGHLNAWGEGLALTDPTGRLVSTNSYVGTPSLAQQFLRITEVMYNSSAAEYIELRNISGSETLDLTGVHFSQGVVFDFTGSAVTSLPPGGYVLVVGDEAAFTAHYGSGLPVAGTYAGMLDNAGETLRLDDAVGEKILELTYNNTWHPITDGLGFSLVINNEHADWKSWGDSVSWRASASLHGSPGAADPVPPAIAGILINEVLTHTDLPQVDTIELHNPEGATVDIGGWFLTDDFYTPRKFRIPEGILLAADGYTFYDETDFNTPSNLPTSFQLSSVGDEVWLFSATTQSNLTGYYHGFEFGAAQNGVSFGRHVTTDGEEHFPAQSALSLGTVNTGPKVGPVVVSEIMYHPADLGGTNNVRDEYIELTNITGANVLLYDPLAPTNTWHLRGAINFDFPQGASIAAGERILIASASWTGTLDNTGETIRLRWPDNPNTNGIPYILTDEVGYEAIEPWPPAADGTGNSLQRIVNEQYGNDPDNWYAAPPRPGAAADLDADSDGDTMDDWAEWKCRTDPLDPNSFMHMGGGAITPAGDFEIFLHTVAGRRYTLDATTNLVVQPFYPYLEGIEAYDNTVIITLTNLNAEASFYRMRLDP